MTSPVRTLARRLRSRLRPRRPRPAILMYHRVASVASDPWGLCVEPSRFDEHMAYLRRSRRPVSMPELVARWRSGTLPSDAVAVTFDDGYRDNLVHAAPILTKHRIPATFFVATGSVDRQTPFWWDELAAMILSARDPARYQLELSPGETFALEWGEPEAADCTPQWRAGDGARTRRQSCYLALWARLRDAATADRERAVEDLRTVFAAAADPLAMPLDIEGVRALVRDEMLTLGAHTVSHPALTTLNASERRAEIVESAERCRAFLGENVEGFAYPYGDLDDATVAEVRSGPFAWACSTRHAFVDRACDPYALPRIVAPDVGVGAFSALLMG